MCAAGHAVHHAGTIGHDCIGSQAGEHTAAAAEIAAAPRHCTDGETCDKHAANDGERVALGEFKRSVGSIARLIGKRAFLDALFASIDARTKLFTLLFVAQIAVGTDGGDIVLGCFGHD